MYHLIRFFLFQLNAELAHKVGLMCMKYAATLRVTHLFFGKSESNSITVMGISFPNIIGLAAGLDKNGDYINGLAQMGFGFVEIGTVTPKAQPGNPKPRLFRLPKSKAIINRMGFNNKGVDYLIDNVKQYRSSHESSCIIGINIGKNLNTDVENAFEDYMICLNKVYQHADYVTINISSPNTPGLRKLQFGKQLKNLLLGLKSRQKELSEQHKKYVPLVVKIAPDMTDSEIHQVAKTFIDTEIDGVVATNTTVSRNNLADDNFTDEMGGLSGKPVKKLSTHVVKTLSSCLKNKIPIIAAGGIFGAQDAQEKIDAGASLVQVYTGFIYNGPKLVHACSKVKKHSYRK